MQLKKSFRIGRFELGYSIRCTIRKGAYTVGIYDLCKDGKHVIFLDYDTFRWEWLIDELAYLQDKYLLSDFYIFSSSLDSYHAVCFDKLVNCELQDVLRETNIDESFFNSVRFDYGARVLRLFPKGKISAPKFSNVIISKHNTRQKSLDHIKAFELHYGIKNINKRNAVELGKTYFIQYYTERTA